MTPRYLTKLRALAAAAIAFAVVPLSLPAFGQEEPAPPPAEAPAAPAEAPPATAPAPAAATTPAAEEAPAEVDEAAAEKKAAYDELIAGQGEYGYAFNFFTISMVWTLLATAMVFIMHLGFATLESGLCQKKNTTNIMFKNVFIICIGLLSYALMGFTTHYPGDNWIIDGIFALGKPIGDLNADGGDTFGYGGVALCMTGYGDFIFQAMFAATAATIVSGAVAERVKLTSFMIFATILVALGYTVAGSWHWGGGFLADMKTPFKDFAGSTVVHGFGGAAALACVLLLGARKGKYTKEGIKPILPHSVPLATIGTLLLFFGWFGFNGGSVLSANPGAIGLVFTTTALAAAAGGISSMMFSWVVMKKPDISMALNGMLAGLVSITAGADSVSAVSSILMGAVGGVLVVLSIIFFDKLKIDDPVGAVSVHGVCGIWGTLAVAIFGEGFSMMSQIIGVVAVYSFAFVFSFVVFLIIKMVMGVRVDEQEEHEGLDVAEHGSPAYND